MSRRWEDEAPLSNFLAGFMQIPDPMTGEFRWFNEPDRRALDLKGLADGTAMSTLSFQPTSRTH
jgi:hypothetical protein